MKNQLTHIQSGADTLRYCYYKKGNLLEEHGKTSFLEITVGVASGLIKRVTLLLSKEYDVNRGKLNTDTYETGDLRVYNELKNSCSHFKTHLYEDGIKIIISEKKVFEYVKIDKLYFGLLNSGGIVEICICQLGPNEVKPIKNELGYR